MKQYGSLLKLSLFLFIVTATTSANAETLQGNWQCRGTDGQHTLTFRANTLVYDREPLAYRVSGNTLLVEDDYGMSQYLYQLQERRLDIQFPDGSILNCQRSSASAPSNRNAQEHARPSGGGVDSATLQAQIAGVWWGYSGSTERKIGLCPGGRYMDYTESSYSGRGYDSGGNETHAWGAASQGGNQGRWTIQGNYEQGTITVQTVSGEQFTLDYSQVGEPGCLNINGSRLCRTSATCN